MRKQKRGPEMFRMSRRASTKESIDDAASEHERLASLTESMRAELAATREELRQGMTEVMANAPAPATAKVLSPKKKKQGSSSSFAAPAATPPRAAAATSAAAAATPITTRDPPYVEGTPLKAGDYVWIERSAAAAGPAFLHARVLDVRPDRVRVLPEGDSPAELRRASAEALQRAAPPGAPAVDDNCDLAFTNDGCMLANLRVRYAAQGIHTWTGPMLIVLNPNTPLPALYDDTTKAEQLPTRSGTGRRPPHVFAVAEEAYRGAVSGSHPAQAVVVSGESGAGKTESARKVLDYLLWRAGSMGKGVGRAALLRSVVASSAVLEAFGNAATGLNHNSSRFGKFLRLRLTADGRVDGAELSSYLLEKSRLAATPRAERNFHALHYLAAAAAALAPLGPLGALVRNADSLEAALHALKLPHPTRLHFLGHGGYVGAADEATRLAPTLDSLAEMMSREQAMEVVRLLAALLHIGNLEFEDSEGVRRGEQAARLTAAGEKAAGHAAALLQCEGFHRPLLVRVVRVGRADGGDTDVYYLPRSAAAAGRARDCLAQELYARLFHFLVVSSNKALGTDPADAPAAAPAPAPACAAPPMTPPRAKEGFLSEDGSPTTAVVSPGGRKADGSADGGRWVGILDVFGFEIARRNSFEQLCINFTNERLLHFALRAAFLAQAAAYAAEGVEVSTVPPPASSKTTSSASS